MRNSLSIVTLMMFIMLLSCTKEPVVIDPPKADFSVEVEGKKATFKNLSAEGKTFAWDFGDGTTSAEENPVHDYAGNGSYVAKLTVTNDGGSDDKQAVLEIINIKVDGDFSEWSSVDEEITGSGTVKKVKVENLDNNKLFLYIEGSEELTPLTQILLNLDNDNTTGAMIDWLYFQAGEDVLIEGSLPLGDEQSGAIYACAPCDGSNPGNWNWGAEPVTDVVTDFVEASELKSVPGGLAYEIAIDLTAMGTSINSEGIGIAVLDVSLDTWGPVGSAPLFYEENDNPEGTLFSYTFK